MPPGLPSPRRAILLALAIAASVLTLPVSTRGRGDARAHTLVDGHPAIEGEVLVKYRDRGALSTHAWIEAGADIDDAETLDPRGTRRLRSRRFSTRELLERLAAEPDVEYAEPNYILYSTAVPNDPLFSSLWGLLNTGVNPVGGGGASGADIDVVSVWDASTGSRTHVVGVIDTGIDYTHPDLAANVWSAPSTFQVTIGGQAITCQAGTHGFNAITRTCDPRDDQYHGTHVAGTIGAVGNNGVGVVGVNWVASMMGLKFLNASGSGTTSDAIAAIEFAIQARAAFAGSGGADVRVLSNSWGGGGYSSALVNAINAANASDMLFVAAAGNAASNNDTSPSYPASYSTPNMVAVASSTSADQLSSFSNYGASSVHLAAPGSAIHSTMPNNAYGTLQGTSMATPQVSGAAMLALSMCTATTAELRTLLLENVDQVAAFATKTTTGGRLNVSRAVQACRYPRVSSVTLAPDVASPRAPGTTVTWTATAAGGEAPYQYQWVVFDGTTWNDATPWQSTNTFAWTPVVASTAYQVAVRARSAWNSGAREASRAAAFTIMPVVTSLDLAPSVAAPQGAGATVTWTASASGGQAPYQYQWAVYDGVTWTTMTSWSTVSTFAWTPATADADYQVAVRARSAWNSGAREMASSAAFAIMPAVSSLTLTSGVASPQAPNTTITLTAAAAGGQAPYQYQWALFNGTTWTDLTSWQSASTYAWTPAVANAGYQVAVRARSAWNSGTREMGRAVPFAIMPFVTSLTLVPSVAAPQGVGTTVTLTAAASGGQAPYQYQWALFNGTTWSDLTGWQSAPTYAWTPTVANGSYQVAVRARGAWNTGARERATALAYAVMPAVTGLTLVPSVASPRAPGTTITWTAAASGGQAPYQYQFALWNGSTWTDLTSWSTTATFAWTPTLANAGYQVAVRARSDWNAGTREKAVTHAFVVMPVVTSLALTPNVTSPRAPGTAITWTAVAGGGQAPYQYQFALWNGSTWTDLTAWSSSSTLTWTPSVANSSYQVAVRARSAWNTGAREMATTQAFVIQ